MGAQAKVISFEESSPVIKFEINGRDYSLEYGSSELEDAIKALQVKTRDFKKDGDSAKYIKAVDDFIDSAFGENTASEIFVEYPTNTYVRAIVVDGIYDAFSESEQKAKIDAMTARFSPETINDGSRD